MQLEINKVLYEVNKRYVCSSVEHGAVESDFVDISNLTPCKLASKWTSDLPTREGYYWIKDLINNEIEIIEVLSDQRFMQFNYEYCQELSCLQSSHEFYGPIEPPEYP